MSTFTRSVSQIIQRTAKAFQTFPASILCALAFTIVTMIRIQMDWPQQEAYNFLFNCLQWSFSLGAVFSLTAITAAYSRFDRSAAFITANLLGAVSVVITFLALYLPVYLRSGVSGRASLSDLALARVIAVIIISTLLFILLAGSSKAQSDFAYSLFMTQKAFFIALIYGVVIMGGASGVAGAVQALLYKNMSGKVYMYIAVLACFLAFTIFLGYFPDFRKGQTDERREMAQKQPRFIEILFSYILIPVVLTLAVVLLLWAGKTVIEGVGYSFSTLAGIAAAYTIGGIWLMIMVTHHETMLAKVYRRVYPISALVILVFELWALIVQLKEFWLKTSEYFFILIWILALAAALLLLIRKDRSHTAIVLLTCMLAAVSVLPAVGYRSLPVAVQINRLENLLIDQGILKEGHLSPSATEPEQPLREKITDSVIFLSNNPDTELPAWFDKNLSDSTVFKSRFGFEMTWPTDGTEARPKETLEFSVALSDDTIDISGYRWAVSLKNIADEKGNTAVTVKGEKGNYTVYWTTNSQNGIPMLKIEKDERVILEQDLSNYVHWLSSAYSSGKGYSYPAPIEDMSLKLNTKEMTVYLVFRNITVNVDSNRDVVRCWFDPQALYLNEEK